ncbi:hypothetical protein [Pararhodospirillum photometricum]|uniref:Uncharacterized protein n=1 Tax=Pararhodospirillum photometricum DSM 122 TaxID=1150469 RepID=H6SPL4_PARPM|nr:hypothetical protein [Pararhodospirillum photometricum]CCG09539.1 Putative uncharacterized protein [Pararhodospirillum photometricum DSM 122]
MRRLALALALALVAPGSPAHAQATAGALPWFDDPPATLDGFWAVNGRCDTASAEMLIFSSGGYRWRKADGSWGFARGSFSYGAGQSYRVLFKVRRLFETEGYDAVLNVSGDTLRKSNIMTNSEKMYRRCPTADGE